MGFLKYAHGNAGYVGITTDIHSVVLRRAGDSDLNPAIENLEVTGNENDSRSSVRTDWSNYGIP